MLRSFWQSKFFTTLLLILGLVLRVLALGQDPQPYDMGTFHAWGNYVWEHGLFATYQNIWSDYLPLPMLVFGALRGLGIYFPTPYPELFRIFWMLVEGMLIWLIANNLPGKNRFLALILWVFPPFIGNTAWWGQIDSTPALLTLLALLRLGKQDNWGSSLCYALAVAIKPVMLVTGPVFAVLGLKTRSIFHHFVVGILTLTLSGIPAITSPDNGVSVATPIRAFQFVFTQAKYQSSMYPGTTINGWNLWSLQGKFWAEDTIPVLGLTAQQWGYFFFSLCVFIILRAWHKLSWSSSHAIFVAGQLLLCFYVFTTRMHERHLMFALPFLVLGSRHFLDRLASIALSLLYIGNLWGALYWVNHSQVWPISQAGLSICSWLVVLATFIILFQDKLHSIITSDYLQRIRRHLPELLILIFVILSRTINLGHPKVMIFDEVYHSFTAQEYLHSNIGAWEWWTTPPAGFAYEWTHPPIAKYGMALGMLLFGENSFGWRIGSAVAGTLSIIGLYFLARKLTGSRKLGILTMLLASLEGLHLVQSRVGMNDTYMLAFLVWSFVQALGGRYKQAAILFGLALASKWSAIYGLIPIALIYLTRVKWTGNYLKHILNITRLILVVALVYLLSFTPFILSGHTASQFVELHRQMWFYHTGLVATHSYESTPLQWVSVARPVWYWVNYDDLASRSNIYAQGNPTLLWFGLSAFVFLFITKPKKHYLELLLAAIFTLPWVFSPRIMFFYHYLPTSFFLTLSSALVIAKLSKNIRLFLITIFIVSFIVMSPLYFGYSMHNIYWDNLFKLFPTWK